jgi:hypothetical protein
MVNSDGRCIAWTREATRCGRCDTPRRWHRQHLCDGHRFFPTAFLLPALVILVTGYSILVPRRIEIDLRGYHLESREAIEDNLLRLVPNSHFAPTAERSLRLLLENRLISDRADAIQLLVNRLSARSRTSAVHARFGVSIKVNGSSDPVTLQPGESFSYSWSSTGMTACQIISPTTTIISGTSLAGNDGPIGPDHPWYPKPKSVLAILFSCTDGEVSLSDLALVYRK